MYKRRRFVVVAEIPLPLACRIRESPMVAHI
jgi:hypothetical protein